MPLYPEDTLFPSSTLYPDQSLIGTDVTTPFLTSTQITAGRTTPDYNFFLANSSDLSLIGQFTKATSRQFTVGLNQAGSASMSVSWDDPLVSYISPVTTALVIKKYNQIVWSGPIWITEEDSDSRTMSISAMGWFELMNHRINRGDTWSTAGVQQVANPTFDSNVLNWNVFVGSLTRDTTVFDLGGASGRMTNGGAGSVLIYTPLTGLSDGVRYRFDLRLRRALMDLGDLVIEVTDTPGTADVFGSLPDTYLIAFSDISTASFGSFSFEFTYTSGTQKYLQIAVPSDVTPSVDMVYVDNVYLSAMPIEFTNTDIGEIAQVLVEYANSNADTGINRGSTQASWNRSFRVPRFANLGEEIHRMSDVENGFDFEVDPETRNFNVYWPYKGTFLARYNTPLEVALASGAHRYYKLDAQRTSVISATAYWPDLANTWDQVDADPVTGDTEDFSYGGSAAGTGTLPNQTALTVNDTPGGFSAGFDGTNDRINIEDYQGFELPPPVGASWDARKIINFKDSSFTIAMLMRATSVSGGRTIFSMSHSSEYANAGGQIVLMVGSDNNLYFMNDSANANQMSTSGALLALNTTHHVAVTFNKADNTTRLYIDGVELAVSSALFGYTGTYYDNNSVVTIGARYSGSYSSFFQGTIDEVGIWMRTLSPSEINYIYNCNLNRQGTVTGPLFGYNWGPKNVQSVRRTTDPSHIVNWIAVTGKGSTAGDIGGFSKDVASIGRYGAFEESKSLGDVQGIQILSAYANAEISVRRTPLQTFEFTPKPNIEASVPDLFVDYNVGDILTLTAKDGTLNVLSQPVRIFGVTVNVDDNGMETISSIETGA